MLKNLAHLGAGTGEGGEIVLVDPDSIERSNLSRQFLFRDSDVGKAKAVTAAAALKQAYPGITVTTFEHK